MAKQTITLNSLIVATPDHVSTDLAGKVAVLGLTNRTYYTLDEVASPIWEWIQEPCRVTDILQRMLQRFEVEPNEAERDLLMFLQQLSEQDLISVK